MCGSFQQLEQIIVREAPAGSAATDLGAAIAWEVLKRLRSMNKLLGYVAHYTMWAPVYL